MLHPMPHRHSARAAPALLLSMLCSAGAATGASSATLEICRTFDIAAPLMSVLVVPGGSLFRDAGRRDDPLAAFNGERWQLRLETIADAAMPPLQQCVRALVRVTGDSSVKSVSVGDNRALVYLGNSSLLDRPVESEELLSLQARVLDHVP